MYKSYWHCRILNKGFSIVSVLFSCLLNFTVRTGKDFWRESWGSRYTCPVMTTVTKPDYSDYSGLYNKVETWIEIHITCLTFMEWWNHKEVHPGHQSPTSHTCIVAPCAAQGPGSGTGKVLLTLPVPDPFHLLFVLIPKAGIFNLRWVAWSWLCWAI